MTAINLISFDVPYPPIYGGIIDVFQKLKYFKKKGIEVHLHCFEYKGEKYEAELMPYCKSIQYYSRKSFTESLFSTMPYITHSRRDEDLIKTLLQNDFPILMEGLHSTYYLNDNRLKNRTKIVWNHNIEWEYYTLLADAEKNFFKKIFFKIESLKLKFYEPVFKYANWVIGVSKNDAIYLSNKGYKSQYIPAFHQNETIEISEGKGDYILYHGSLDVAENHLAAMWLIEQVFAKVKYKCIIAGKKPSIELIEEIKKHQNIELKNDISIAEMSDLITNAQIHTLPTFQATGIKHKLLNALHKGRFVIANEAMVSNTGMEDLCQVANSGSEMISSINALMQKPFDQNEINKRKNILETDFNNDINMDKLIKLLFENK
jgi:hypothetical protein